jgi:hypothetical protein
VGEYLAKACDALDVPIREHHARNERAKVVDSWEHRLPHSWTLGNTGSHTRGLVGTQAPTLVDSWEHRLPHSY